jgi:methylthioribose-1-phosphate isomerase
MVLQAINYLPARTSAAASLEIIDQLALPHRSTYLPITSCEDAWAAIREMKVRGAPAIAIVAALSLAVELSRQGITEKKETTSQEVGKFIHKRLEYLKSSRPTAVNLGDAVGKLKAVADKAESIDGAIGHTVAVAYIEATEKMLIDDVKDNEAIGKYGARWIRERTKAGKRRDKSDGELKVITHCNTGYMDDASLLFGSAADHRPPGHLPRLVMAQRSV